MPDNIDIRGPSNVPLRPINGGMIRNLPSNGLPPGSFLRLQNYRVHEYGIRRRGGFRPFNSNQGQDALTDIQDKVYDLIFFYPEAGQEPQMLALTEKQLYLLSSTNTATVVEPDTTDNFTISTNTASQENSQEIEVTFTVTSETLQYDRGFKVYYKDGVNDSFLLGEVFAPGSVNLGVGTLSVTLSDLQYYNGISIDELAGFSLKVVPSFISEVKFGPNYATVPSPSSGTPGYVVIADQSGSRLWKYDGTFLNEFVPSNPDYLTSAKVVTYFEDRLWFGNTVEVDGQHLQRIRWSDAFNYDSVQAASYVDLPYGEGELLSLVPMGSLLVAYYEDAIYLGRPTQIRGLPYRFQKLETGNMGLVAKRAVIPWQDGHYFVGQDDVYSLSATTALAPIGAPILSESLEYTKELGLMEYVQVEHDPYSETICFLFPDLAIGDVPLEGSSTRIWRFNYKIRNWAYDEVNFLNAEKTQPAYVFSGLAPSRFFILGRSWEDWIGEDPEETPINVELDVWSKKWLPNFEEDAAVDDAETFYSFNTWDNLKQEILKSKKLYLPCYLLDSPNQRQTILEEFTSGDADYLGDYNVVVDEEIVEREYPVWSVLESPDFDFGTPDISKTVNRLSLKYFTNRVSRLTDALDDAINGLVFTLNISDSMGYRWKRPLTLRFKENYNEGRADFRSTGSTFRFKLVNGQQIEPFKLSEMVMRVIGRGLQIDN